MFSFKNHDFKVQALQHWLISFISYRVAPIDYISLNFQGNEAMEVFNLCRG